MLTPFDLPPQTFLGQPVDYDRAAVHYLADSAQPVSGEKFVAFVERYADCALIHIFPRKGKLEIDFTNRVACYETLSNGAFASARREIAKLTAEQVAA